MAGIYLHVPFCNSKCVYCGFYSVTSRYYRDKYVPALEREIVERRNFFSSLYETDRTIKTLYIGGGTPSVLDVSALERIVFLLKENFNFPAKAFFTDNPDEFEFTVEVNPDDITHQYARSLKSLGVNRVSMGVQSFNDSHLRWMGRRHSSLEAVEAFRILREAGFTNISLDLIFGFPSMTGRQLEENLQASIALAPEHISAYQLGVDSGSRLESMVENGKAILLPEEVCASMYHILQQRLAEAGYEQYEVSNFAKESALKNRSRHNCSYWKRIPYVGFGPGAHSFIGSHREWNYTSIESYCDLHTVELREGENLSPEDVFNETLMLGLRTAEGVSMEELRQSSAKGQFLLNEALPAINCLSEKKLLDITPNGRIKIPSGKFFISDGIIRDLFV